MSASFLCIFLFPFVVRIQLFLLSARVRIRGKYSFTFLHKFNITMLEFYVNRKRSNTFFYLIFSIFLLVFCVVFIYFFPMNYTYFYLCRVTYFLSKDSLFLDLLLTESCFFYILNNKNCYYYYLCKKIFAFIVWRYVWQQLANIVISVKLLSIF